MAISIRNLINRITAGDIRIPAFQRDYVWEPDQAAFLLDSIYKGFPIGTVVLWKTDTRMSTEKKLGSFVLPEPAKDYPVNYVLDGQQRLTSIFSTFQSDLKATDNEWIDLYFDMLAEAGLQESCFAAFSADEVDFDRYFPVKTLFSPVEYQKSCTGLTEEKLSRVHQMAAKFYEFLIPSDTFESDDRNAVAIVFERINRSGTELDVFELLSAWSWSDDFDLVERFKGLQNEIASHGYHDLMDDKDLQLRICAGVITGETTPAKILEMQGEQIRNNFKRIENGIIGAIDFLKSQLFITHFKLLPFPGILVPLSVFFATEKSDGIRYTDSQRDIIAKWFWRTAFTRRFSSDVNERQAHDIVEMRKLLADPAYDFKLPNAECKIDFLRANFSSGTANTKTFIAMLNFSRPRSFLSGALVDTSEVLKKGSKHEYHHIFPQAFLRGKGFSPKEINVLSNICFLTRADNNLIKDRDPNSYVKDIPAAKIKEYTASSLCPDTLGDLDYADFLEARAALLDSKAAELMA